MADAIIDATYGMIGYNSMTNNLNKNSTQNQTQTQNQNKVPSSSGNAANQLSRAQNRNINTLNNIIDNNLKPGDFSGTLADLY
jgi:hypothetical protein